MQNRTINVWIKILFISGFAIVVVALLALPIQICYFGISSFDKNVFSIVPSVVNTMLLVLFTVSLSVPIALFAAMFLWFYDHHIPRLVNVIQALIDSLGAVPSIVYALFGLMLFVDGFGLGFSLLAGVFTMTVIVLPIIIRACEQALRAVPKDVYLSGISLGQSKIYVMLFVLLPQARYGIYSGVLLSVGRIIGESAALIFTLGTAGGVIHSFLSSGRTLAVQVYAMAGEGLFLPQAYATSFVLLIFAVLLNCLSEIAIKRGTYE